VLRGALSILLAWLVLAAAPAFAESSVASGATAELAQLDAAIAARPDDVEVLAARARLHEAAGRPMQAFLDRREIMRHRPDDVDTARLAASNLMAAGAPGAAAAWLERYPAAGAGAAGAVVSRQLAGDVAARHVRWGWDEPVLDPSRRQHEADAAIVALEAMRAQDSTDRRAAQDLLLAYRLADRMADVVALWEKTLRSDDAPYWVRNPVADAYLALGRPAEAEALYRSFAAERGSTPQPWLGIYWAAIEQRHYDDAGAALDRLAQVPGQELTVEVQRGWLLLFADRTAEAQRHFENLFDRYPGAPSVRDGLATSYLWQGWPRRGERDLKELIARTTLPAPVVDNPSARIALAGALSSLGDLHAAQRQAADLASRYPENVHAQRLRRDIDTALSPEARVEGRYDTSDRGLGESWGQLELSVPWGTRTRLAAGSHSSRSEDVRYEAGDMRDAYLGISARPRRWLSASAEVDFDVAGNDVDHDPAYLARLALLPDDRWRLDFGYNDGAWRELPLRARAAGLTADVVDFGVAYTASPRWNARAGGGRSEMSDGNVRRWGLLVAQRLVREGPVYRAHFGVELYSSDNSRSDVAYFSPRRDRSASLTHRSEWVTTNAPGRRHTFSLLLHAGAYDQEGFDVGPVGGAWLESDWDLSGRTVLVVGAGARNQLYDGSRELDPRFYLTVRRRF
jgi:biofilm PGA synthesis protein PgaA